MNAYIAACSAFVGVWVGYVVGVWNAKRRTGILDVCPTCGQGPCSDTCAEWEAQ